MQAAAPYPNLHIVDFRGMVATQLGGIRVAGEWLTGDRFGGLFSLDGLHLTDTAYGLYANFFIDAMNGVLARKSSTSMSTPSTPKTRTPRRSCAPPA